MDAANIMKPALARGGVRCIGATTVAEYRRHIEPDAALERRFERITVEEPSQKETLAILRGLQPKMESHHGVAITKKAIEAAVALSLRFDHDRRLPDKAIDTLDLAAARVVIPRLSIAAKPGKRDLPTGRVTPAIVAQVLAQKFGLPPDLIAGHLRGMNRRRLLELETRLNARVIGQSDAIRAVCGQLLVAYSGVGARKGPLGVFLFAGPTGVGKTELAKALGDGLFGGDKAVVRLDMSEYMEPHSVAKLVGSPAGYVGYEAEGQLTGRLRTQPYSLVLLDEVEKAHPQVLDIFLQLFDEGRLTDAKGRTVDARNCVFVMTSNVRVANRKARLGFGAGETEEKSPALLSELKKHFRTEFINRIDQTVLFRSLTEEDALAIARLIVAGLTQRLASTASVRLTVVDAALRFIAQTGYNEEFGVRHLSRTVEEKIERPLAEQVLAHSKRTAKEILVDVEANELVFRSK
jgi:ATP-dependent Clp protease ATP-binding subunit ClpC